MSLGRVVKFCPKSLHYLYEFQKCKNQMPRAGIHWAGLAWRAKTLNVEPCILLKFTDFTQYKGLVINYWEGGGGGGEGGYKMGKSQVRNFLCSPPQDRVKLFVSPLLKSGNFLHPLSIWLKLQATAYKLPQNLLCPPFSMANTFSAPRPPFP